jgi:hypothetical protein
MLLKIPMSTEMERIVIMKFAIIVIVCYVYIYIRGEKGNWYCLIYFRIKSEDEKARIGEKKSPY